MGWGRAGWGERSRAPPRTLPPGGRPGEGLLARSPLSTLPITSPNRSTSRSAWRRAGGRIGVAGPGDGAIAQKKGARSRARPCLMPCFASGRGPRAGRAVPDPTRTHAKGRAWVVGLPTGASGRAWRRAPGAREGACAGGSNKLKSPCRGAFFRVRPGLGWRFPRARPPRTRPPTPLTDQTMHVPCGPRPRRSGRCGRGRKPWFLGEVGRFCWGGGELSFGEGRLISPR
jgi:hypothetical protein